MHTTASLHVHPAAASPELIFKIRRLAKDHGCVFARSNRARFSVAPSPTTPGNGGFAA